MVTAAPMMIHHGGTDAGPTPKVDCSTNANPYGPSPFARAALDADIAAYPDPAYQHTRAVLGAHHGVSPREIVVGAGATELIYRLVQAKPGPVAAPFPGFGEYAAAAAMAKRPFIPLPPNPDHHHIDLPEHGLAFITNPGSPDGRLRCPTWVEALQRQADAKHTWLVWDVAYHQMVAPESVTPMILSQGITLFAPNKAHGCTGLRAGYVHAPAPIANVLTAHQMSWVVSTIGAAFLTNQAQPAADAWIRTTMEQVYATKAALLEVFAQTSWPIQSGDSPWFCVQVPQATQAAAYLRHTWDIKVRDLTSQGLPGWWRIAAPHHDHLVATQSAFTDVIARYH